ESLEEKGVEIFNREALKPPRLEVLEEGQEVEVEEEYYEDEEYEEITPLTSSIEGERDTFSLSLSSSEKKGPYFQKDEAKANKANKFIGRGSEESSTEAYRKAVGDR